MRKELEKTNMALISQDISYIKEILDDLKKQLEEKYVTKEEFQPVKLIAFGLVGVSTLAVLGALVALVIKK